MIALGDRDFVRDYLEHSVAALQLFSASAALMGVLDQMVAATVAALQAGGKLMIAGNGGSAADAQHLAAEFTGRMLYDRPPLAALALHCDSSALTAIANDYGFEHVFERQVLAMARPGDVLLALSTSGTSVNILRALDAAKARCVVTMGFTGESGGAMVERTDLLLRLPSSMTPVVQQVSIVAGHLLCALVERAMHPASGSVVQPTLPASLP